MRLLRLLSLLLLSAAIAWPVAAQADLRFNGSLSNQFRLRLYQSDMPDDMDWDMTMLLTNLDVIGRATNDDRNARLFFNADLTHDPTGVLEDELEWRLRQAYAGYYAMYWNVEIGKRIFSWGMADEFNPTDLLNSEDMRWFITRDKLDRKIGVYAGSATVSYGNFSLQGVIVPIFEPVKLPAEDSDWLPWQLETFYAISNAFPDYVDAQEELPEQNIGNAEYAARLRGTIGTVDIEAVVFDGYDQLPTYDIEIDTDLSAAVLDGEKPLHLIKYYQRYQAYGGSLAWTIGSFSLRGEGAYYTPRRYLYRIDDSLLKVDNIISAYDLLLDYVDHEWGVEKPSWSAVGGVDWREGTMIYVNMQYVHTQILDYEDDLLYDENEGFVTLKLQTMWLDEELTVAANGAYNTWQGDWYIKPYVNYKLTQNLSAELGSQIFSGDEETRFGDMDDNDFVYTLVNYSF